MPAARLVPVTLRVAVVAATALTAWSVRRALVSAPHPGRMDQRAEDALDDLDEGLALHRTRVLGDAGDNRQTNAAARFRRVIRFRGQRVEIDAGFLGRIRLRQVRGE